jgi:TRAP-type C4-dicarboxylate transport system permease small subunit
MTHVNKTGDAIDDKLPVALLPPFTFLTRCNAWLSLMCMRLAVAGLVLIAVAVFGQIFGRYVLNNSPSWTEALALLMVLYVTNIGVAVCVRDDRHMGVELLTGALPPRVRVPLKIFIHLLVILFAVLMIWNGWILGRQIIDYMIPNLGVSQGLTYWPLMLSGSLIVLFSIEHIIALLQRTRVVPSWH